MSPRQTEAERTPHAQCRDACAEPHRWFNIGDGVGGLKYWCEGPRPAIQEPKCVDAAVRELRQTLYQDAALPLPFQSGDTVEVRAVALHAVLALLSPEETK